VHQEENNNNGEKDLKDYLATHKMLLELDKIENEESVDQSEKEKNEINVDALNESILKEMGMNYKEGFVMEDPREENIDDQLNCKYNFEDLENDKKDDKPEKEKHENGVNNFQSNSDDFTEILRSELENELEKQHFEKLYKIVDENTKSNMVCFEYDTLNKHIYEEFSGKFDSYRIDNFVNRVPELFAIILRDRESLIENKQ